MKKKSMKAVISLWYTVILIIFMVLVVAGILWISTSQLVRSVKEELTDEVLENVEEIEFKDNEYDFSDVDNYDDGVITVIYDVNGNLVYGMVPAGFPEKTVVKDGEIQFLRKGMSVWYIYDLQYNNYGKNKIIVRGIVPLDHEFMILKNVLIASAIIILLLGVVGLYIGYLITERAFLPIGKIVSTVKSIKDGQDISKRIDLKGADDEIKAVADTYDEMLDYLQVAFEREKQFTSDVSHELRTPNAVIQSQCEYALVQAQENEELTYSLKVIQRQSKKMTKLISELLMFARMDSKEYPLHQETFDLIEILYAMAEEMSENDSLIKVLVENKEAIPVVADQTLIMRMFMNLISNGIKYGKPNGYVKINITCEEKEVRIQVEDNGIGIEPEELDKIWDRFYRANKNRSIDKENSAGLGLSMVKWIVHQYDGRASVKSKPGQGTTFEIFLKILP